MHGIGIYALPYICNMQYYYAEIRFCSRPFSLKSLQLFELFVGIKFAVLYVRKMETTQRGCDFRGRRTHVWSL